MAFDERKAQRVVRFIEALRHTKGEFHGQPFHLLPWQEKIIRDVFGTVRDDDPTMRQYTTAYIEIPKKNGKSELGAAIALNMLINDDEWKAEVYSCASDRQQAAIVFDVAVDMVRQSPALMKRVKIIPSTRRMIYQPTGSIYQVLSSEVATKHGLNVSACIFDELHTQPTRALYDVMTQGSGDAQQAAAVVFADHGGHRPQLHLLGGASEGAGHSGRAQDRPALLPGALRPAGRRGLDERGKLVPGQSRRWTTPSPSTRCATPSARRRRPRRTRTSSASCA